MAGNNDDKLVRLSQLDKLTKSLDARNLTIVQNVRDELISAVEDVEKKLFSKDYNDLINKPCYEISEVKLFNNDGDNAGRLIVDKGTTNVKFAKVSEDEIDFNSIDQVRFSQVIDDVAYEVELDPGTFIVVENETGSAISINEFIICTFNDNFAMDMLGSIVTFPEKGLYFSFDESSDQAWHLDNIYLPIASVKQLDDKFISDNIARMEDIIELEEDNLSIEGMIENTFPNLTTDDKTITGAINELHDKVQNFEDGSEILDVVAQEVDKLRDEMVILEEDDLTMDGLVDNTFPGLTTENKTLTGAINELNDKIQNFKVSEEIEEAVVKEILMEILGVTINEDGEE